VFGGAPLQDQLPVISREQLAIIMFGTVYVFIGLAACAFAAVRRREEVRLFLWLGTWSAMYGGRLLAESPAMVDVLPQWIQFRVPFVWTVIVYLVVPVATLAWLELSIGRVRVFLQAVLFLSGFIGVAGIVIFVITGSRDRLLSYNNLLAAFALLVLVVVVLVPQLSRKFLVLPNRAVVIAGTLIFALQGMYYNLARALHYPTTQIPVSLAFGALLFSFGYIAAGTLRTSERRLTSIENELEIAREIQASILPNGNPELKNLRVCAAYRPMTAVAGDFYEFIAVDENRTGVLVADVTGHGVPAALIAAMIKVAMQSVMHCALNPGEVLRELNRILSPQLRAQLVSAAYLWLDTENRVGSYSAAGHPPLLHWREGKLERVESNGVLLGVLPEPDYPVCDVALKLGDRFLLYTDGVTEPENTRGDAFGDTQLEQVIRANHSRPGSELLQEVFSEIRQWQPTAVAQKDDITLIVVDIVS
jgi:sigma-B regulation protein RsbU (phosphoserine phosphatase)